MPRRKRKAVLDSLERDIRAEVAAEIEHVLIPLVKQVLRRVGDLGNRGAAKKRRRVLRGTATNRKQTRKLRQGSDQMKVLQMIQARPGQRGVDLAAALAPVNERTVRTALNRLKKHHFIEQKEGRWYAAKS